MTSPYQTPTMELRFVERRVALSQMDPYPFEPIMRTIRVLQQKWIVQDGEAYPLAWAARPRTPRDIQVAEGAHYDAYPWFASVKDEWRDVPLVTDTSTQ